MTAATTDQTATVVQDENPMLMVVTLKSGVQIKTDVEAFTVRRTRGGELVGLKWDATENTQTSIEYLDTDEVAAVHAEWPKATGGAADAG
jgi:hypothetical protein